jgi:hypothetical protein
MKILRIEELCLTFKNSKNKVIELKFDELNIKQFKHKSYYIDMSKLSLVPRDYKIFKIRRSIVNASPFKNETEYNDNVLIHITKSVPMSILIQQYNEFISRYSS